MDGAPIVCYALPFHHRTLPCRWWLHVTACLVCDFVMAKFTMPWVCWSLCAAGTALEQAGRALVVPACGRPKAWGQELCSEPAAGCHGAQRSQKGESTRLTFLTRVSLLSHQWIKHYCCAEILEIHASPCSLQLHVNIATYEIAGPGRLLTC